MRRIKSNDTVKFISTGEGYTDIGTGQHIRVTDNTEIKSEMKAEESAESDIKEEPVLEAAQELATPRRYPKRNAKKVEFEGFEMSPIKREKGEKEKENCE